MGLLRKLRHAVESAGLLDPGFHKNVMASLQGAITAVSGMMNGDDSLALLVSDHLLVDCELKKLLREGMERLKSYALGYAQNPLATSLFLRHWSFQPSTLANYIEVPSPLDALYQLENSLRESAWWESPSTLSNRVELHRSAKILQDGVQEILSLVPEICGANIKQMLVNMQQIAAEDPVVKDVLERIRSKLESLSTVGAAIQESRVASAIADGVSRIQEKKTKMIAASQLEICDSEVSGRLSKRGRLFVERLKREQGEIQAKVADIAVAGMDRYGSVPTDQIEEWLIRAKQVVEDSLEKCRAKLFTNLQCFGVEDKVGQLLRVDPQAFPRAVEDVLAQSSLTAHLSGTHLRNLYNKNQTDLSEYTSRSLLNALEGADIYIPPPIMEAIVAASAGDNTKLSNAITDTLDAEHSVEMVNNVITRGENALDDLMAYANRSVQGGASEAIFHAVVDKMDNDKMEESLFSSIKQFDANEVLTQAEGVFNQVDALSALANNIKDSVLQFVLEILPVIRLPKISDVYDAGFAGEIVYSLDNLDLSGFRFRKEDVELLFPEDLEKTFVIELVAKNVSATFTNLKISLEQQSFPYMSGNPVASADAQGISLTLEFTMDHSGKLGLSQRSIEIESLSLAVEEIGLAFLVNALTALFSSVIKDYVKTSLEEKIAENIDPLLDTLNCYVDGLPLILRSKLRSIHAPASVSPGDIASPLESARSCSTHIESARSVQQSIPKAGIRESRSHVCD